MMMLYRLVRLIENNSEALAAGLLERVEKSEAMPDYRNVPATELRERVYEIYRHLGDWLITKDAYTISNVAIWQLGRSERSRKSR